MLTSKWTLPLGKERRRSQKHNRNTEKETPWCFYDVSENPSVQWKRWEGNHRTGRDKAFRTGRDKAFSALLLESKRKIQALPNPEGETSFQWLTGWMIAAKANMVLAAKSPQHFTPTCCVCTPNRWMDIPAICFSVSSGCYRKGRFGNRNFFTRAKHPFAFQNPLLSIKPCFRGTVIYNLTKDTRPRWNPSFMTLLYGLAKQYGSAHIG